MEKYKSHRSQVSMVYRLLYTLFFFIFAGLKFRENFVGTFHDTSISRSRRNIVFAGNLFSRDSKYHLQAIARPWGTETAKFRNFEKS